MVVRIYQRSDEYYDKLYPIAEVEVEELRVGLKAFAKRHGGDIAEVVDEDDTE